MTVLKQGSRGDEVRELQTALNAAGFNLVIDGIFGPKTALAVREYQQANGITVDGIVGTQTWGSLQGTAPATDPADPATTVKTTGAKDSYTGGDDRFHGLGGKPEIWYNSDTGESLLVYFVPGTDPPVPMTWKVEKDEDLAGWFGEGQEVIYDRVLSESDLEQAGAFDHGIATEIDVTEGNPFEGWASQYEAESKTRPYLLDPEVAALVVAAGLEGRVPSRAEMEATEWFQTHSDAQLDWIIKEAGDPVGAAAELDSNRRYVKQALISAGIYNPDDRIIEYIADRFTTGLWTQTMMNDQINAVADPYYDAPMDEGLQGAIDDPDDPISYDRTSEKEEWVRETARKWLGPVYGTLSDDQVRDIAGRLRNDPNYEEEWVGGLKAQRTALFPGYTDIDATYDEIAQPWRSVWFDVMGSDADETATVFQDVVQANDLTAAKTNIRRHGLETNNEKVSTDFARDAFRAFGRGEKGLIST